MKHVFSIIIFVCCILIFVLTVSGLYEMTIERLGYLVLAAVMLINSKT